RQALRRPRPALRQAQRRLPAHPEDRLAQGRQCPPGARHADGPRRGDGAARGRRREEGREQGFQEDREERSQGRSGLIYTVGHGARSAEQLIAILKEAGIGTLVDVRAYPASRRHPQFSRQPLSASLEKAGIAYRWEGKALGGMRPSYAD